MKENNQLFVSECFYSIQGEGKTVGTPAVFLRLSGCNILCKSESWICDTIEVWKKGVKTDFDDVFCGRDKAMLRNGAHLVITGGEPLLHQKQIEKFLKWLESFYELNPFVEIETNGTILPNEYLQLRVNQWNVSPKLQNSGEHWDKRFKDNVINVFKDLNTSIFKFVIEKEEDFKDLAQTYMTILDSQKYRSKIYLMPAGENQEQLLKTRQTVVEICKQHCLKFTDRSHIVIWDKKTGV